MQQIAVQVRQTALAWGTMDPGKGLRGEDSAFCL
jgi:hypothetical protein